MTAEFPWGERNPAGGYQVGDRVGIIYSDHEHHIFDNPDGEIVAVEHDEDQVGVTISLQVTVWNPAERLYLIGRPGDDVIAAERGGPDQWVT